MSYKPQTLFSGSHGEASIDKAGPVYLTQDLQELAKMFDPDSTHRIDENHPTAEPGGIGKENLAFTISNDFTDGEKQNVADNTNARHTHSNKSALDTMPSGGVVQTLSARNTEVPTCKAVTDAMSGAGLGNMTKAEYDPTTGGVENPVAAAGGIPNFVRQYAGGVIDTIKHDGVALPVVDKTVDIPKELFIATYSTTTFAELTTAYTAGKDIVVIQTVNTNKFFYVLSSYENSVFNFVCNETGNKVSCSSSGWTSATQAIETATNKVTALSSASTDVQYPSAKCVYEELEDKVDSNEEITGGTYAKITFDSKGLVTDGDDLDSSDIPSLDASKITSGAFADERIESADDWNGKQSQHSALTKTLIVGGWSSNTQRIAVSGVTASNTVIISPAPESITNWLNAQIYCSSQELGYLTFVCTTTPTSAITVNIVILN